jgi:phosphoribosylformylglycinamidine synthase
MLTALREIIPGGSGWPRFVRNRSERFEARLALVEVPESPSLFLRGMTGARLPVVVSHGEGRLEPQLEGHVERLESDGLVALRYVHPSGTIAMNYPQNPNGSPRGITGVTTRDGRITALMPHPERVFRTSQLSWHPRTWGEDSPWMRFFRNARAWVG